MKRLSLCLLLGAGMLVSLPALAQSGGLTLPGTPSLPEPSAEPAQKRAKSATKSSTKPAKRAARKARGETYEDPALTQPMPRASRQLELEDDPNVNSGMRPLVTPGGRVGLGMGF